MSTLVQTYEKHASAPAESPAIVQASVASPSLSCRSSLYRKQIRSLVEQLFFSQSAPVHHIGLIGADNSGETEHLCFDLVRVLADGGRKDIGLIDANPLSVPLENQLELSPPEAPHAIWPVGPHLWFVPRKSWIGGGETFADQSTAHLREFIAEFDFSILHCSFEPWLITRIGRMCDGFVLVLTAHRSRRLAAMQIRDQIRKMQVPLLGTVLSDRRFPIPETIYQSL